MTYVISDIHGRYDKYSAMLDMIRCPNIYILMENHEAMMPDTLLEKQSVAV